MASGGAASDRERLAAFSEFLPTGSDCSIQQLTIGEYNAKLYLMNQFSEQLRTIIDDSGMTMQAAAAAIGMDKGNLSRIINGKEGVTMERAERIANALGATISVKLKKLKKISVA